MGSIFLIGVLYFFLPLVGTFQFSLKDQPCIRGLHEFLDDPQFFASLGSRSSSGSATIIVSMAMIVPTAFWVRLRVPARDRSSSS